MLGDNFNDLFQKCDKYLIALEGCNGSGKTTLCKMLSSNYRIPYVAGIPLEMHDNLKLREKLFSSKYFESAFLYYLSGVLIQRQFIKDIPKPYVIMDRSILSTLAYHYSIGGNLRLKHILTFLRLLEDKPVFPDLTIWLDAPRNILTNRIIGRNGNDLTDIMMVDATISEAEVAFYSMAYDEFRNAEDTNIIRIEVSSLSIGAVFQYLVATIDEHLKQRRLLNVVNDE